MSNALCWWIARLVLGGVAEVTQPTAPAMPSQQARVARESRAATLDPRNPANAEPPKRFGGHTCGPACTGPGTVLSSKNCIIQVLLAQYWWRNMSGRPQPIRAILCDHLYHMMLSRGPRGRKDLRCAARACRPIISQRDLRNIGPEFPIIPPARERIHYLRKNLSWAKLFPPPLTLPAPSWLRLADRQSPQSLPLRRHLVACRIEPDRPLSKAYIFPRCAIGRCTGRGWWPALLPRP